MTKYRVICADPPWSFEDKLRMRGTVGVRRSAEAHYATMDLADIIALPVGEIAADDAVLALWVPNSLLQAGLDTMKAWGFNQKQLFTWVKTTKNGKLAFNMGRNFRNCSESALIGTRGRPKTKVHDERNVSLDLQLRHSAKPDTLQSKLERMFDGPRLELFARRAIGGWTCVGDECPGTIGVDIREWFAARVGQEAA